MEHPNENMEEFFRNSLDKFSDDPSEMVWHGLDARLDQDKPKGFIMHWIKYLLPAALLLFSLSGFYIYQQKQLGEYKVQLSAIVEENKELKQEMELIGNSISGVTKQEDNDRRSITLDDTEKDVIFKDVFIVERDTVYIVKYINEENKNALTSAFPKPSFSFAADNYERVQFNASARYKSLSAFASYDHAPAARRVGTSGGKNYSDDHRAGFMSAHQQRGENAITLYPQMELAMHGLQSMQTTDPFLSKMKYIDPNKRRRKKKKKKPGLYEPKGPIIIAEGDVWGQPEFYYRGGISFNVLSSLKGEQLSNSSLGFGYGLTQEIGLTSRFALTSGILFTHQEYAMSNGDLPLDDSEIGTFPNQENLSGTIERVEVENKFWEIPVGIKYDFYQDNLKSFFINPAVKWSIHRPQTFSYYLSEDRFSSFSTDKKFAYLNAVNFALGIEKIVNPSIIYQVSLGYDYNLEPIGIEQQRLNSLYLKFNLLFGKK